MIDYDYNNPALSIKVTERFGKTVLTKRILKCTHEIIGLMLTKKKKK